CTGNAPVIPTSITQPIRTMTATIASEMGEVAYGGVYYHALFMVGVVLFVLTLGTNVLAKRAIGRFQFVGK
ncbi:MAG TPA: phosphate ABC transporter permease subunit PstC, partial [Planctomycetota bacterium]|nr:phosphate ABC transporter permease subunit PstC [Planctomycetota bacterium]